MLGHAFFRLLGRFGVAAAALAGMLVPGSAWAEEAGATPNRYVPPKLGAPDNRVSGATRGIHVGPARLDVLAPRTVGLTTREQPTLYWFNSRPIGGDALLTIVEGATNETVVKATVPGPLAAGIHAFQLAGTHGRIRDGIEYRWSLAVAAAPGDPSQYPVASGMIQRVERSVPQAADKAGALAAAGLWYDAVDEVSQAIRRAPADQNLHKARGALLDQAGLTAAAAFDRTVSR